MNEDNIKRLMSRLAFIRTDLAAIERFGLDKEIGKIVEEMQERAEMLKNLCLDENQTKLNLENGQ